MSLPPSAFADAFRAHAVPKLSRLCEAHGLFIALGLETVSEAHAAVISEAWRADAQHLPEEHFAELEDWLFDTLMTAAVSKQAMIEARDASVAHVTEDVMKWDAAVRALNGQ